MRRIIPGDVKDFIDQSVPVETTRSVDESNVGPMETVIKLVEDIPDELIVLDSKSYIAFAAALSQLTSAVRSFRNEQVRDRYQQPASLGTMPLYDKLTPLAVLRRELDKCWDNVPPLDLPDLAFIKDPQLRDILLKDLASVAVALARDEWKAATVLAGSVVEALLLYALDLRGGEIPGAIVALEVSGDFKRTRDANQLERWNLSQYIKVAKHLNEIDEETAKAADQTREFRNLIHPGRAQRTQQTCTRGTAHIAFGALQLTIDDLARRHH